MKQMVIGLVVPNEIMRTGMREYIVRRARIPDIHSFESLGELENSMAVHIINLLFWDTGVRTSDSVINRTQRLSQKYDFPVVILSDKLQIDHIRSIMRHGARGFIFKQDDLEQSVLNAISTLSRDAVYLSPKVTQIVSTGEFVLRDISPRARKVLNLLAAGKTVPEIAKDLNVSKRTVYRDRDYLREALHVDTSDAIVPEALKQGLL